MRPSWNSVALRAAVVALLHFTACSGSLRLEGDCVGAVRFRNSLCTRATCSIAPGADMVAEDVDGCVFVSWSNQCSTARGCQFEEGLSARFKRIAWPLTIDATGAPNTRVSVNDALCGGSCMHLVPVGLPATIRAESELGYRPSFAGDCVQRGTGECVVAGDRPRFVLITEEEQATVEVEVRVEGPASVEVGANRCTSGMPCRFMVTVGTQLHLIASSVADVDFQWGGAPGCIDGRDCRVVASDSIAITLRAVAMATLSVSKSGEGSIAIDGIEYQAPVVVRRPVGSSVTIRAMPSAGFAVSGFRDLDCLRDRLVDDCTVTIGAPAWGTVVFERFVQWALPLHGEVTDLAAADGSVLLAATYINQGFGGVSPYRQSLIVEFAPDAGLARRTESTFGMRSLNFVRTGDGGIVLTGAIVYHRSPGPGLAVSWNGYDASTTGTSGQRSDLGLVDFDVNRFAVAGLRVLDLPEGYDVTELGRSPLTWTPEGELCSFASLRDLDGGAGPHTSLSTVTPSGQLIVTQAFPSLVPLDMVRFGASSLALLLHRPNTAIGGLCAAQPLAATPALASVDQTTCNAVVFSDATAPPHDATFRWYESVGHMARDLPFPAFPSTTLHSLPIGSVGAAVSTFFGHVHAHEPSLGLRWTATLEPVLVGTSAQGLTALDPITTLEWAGRVLAFFGGTGAGVSGYRSSSGLTIPCDPAADARLLITMHDAVSGRTEWGTCLLEGPTATGVRPWRSAERQNPILGFNRQPLPIKAFGGILLAPLASAAMWPADFAVGSDLIQFSFDSSYLLLVSPPSPP